MSIRELKPLDRDADARRVLKERLDGPDKMNLVIVIEQYTDGSRRLISSAGSMEEKALLKCFLDSFIMRWFNDDTQEIEPV